jgi:hypothetical protein
VHEYRALLADYMYFTLEKSRSYFPDWIVARLGVMEFLASGLGDTAIVNDQTYLRGIQHLDAGPRHAASFVLCDDLVIA